MSNRMYERAGAEVWVALDVPSIDAAVDAIRDLRTARRPFGIKVGLELVTAEGLPRLMPVLWGQPYFADCKFLDIPNTVAGAAKALQQFHPAIFNVHASGGVRMMEAAVKERGHSNVFAVTVLTSMGDIEASISYGCGSAKAGFSRFAALASTAGCQGLICSSSDLTVAADSNMLRLCPGIRPIWASAKGDQTRVTTPAQVAVLGADGIVVGRPVLSPPAGISRKRALQMVYDEFHLMSALRDLGGILDGHYVYKSGRHGSMYFNKDVLWGTTYAEDAALAIIDSLPEDYHYDVVVGPETGGAKLAKLIGNMMGKPALAASKTADGFTFEWNLDWKEALVVEDVLTTGGSLEKVLLPIGSCGANVTVKRALLNRGGVQMSGLETIATLDAVSYSPEECLLCRAGVPICTDVGHAKPKT